MPSWRRRTLRMLLLAALGAVAALTFLMGVVGFGAGTVIAWIGLAFYARPGAREHAALPSLGEGAFPVHIEVRYWGRRIGRENGWVAFADGWLVYEGLRTSFSIRSGDATPAHGLSSGFDLRLAHGLTVKVGLLTDPMQTSRPAKFCDHILLLEALQEWENFPAPAGEPVLPPRETSPHAMGEAIGERIAGAAITFILGVTAALAELAWPWTFLCACVVFLFALDIARRTRRLRQSLAPPDDLRVR